MTYPNTNLGQYFDIGFFIKFILVLLPLYYFHIFYWGVTLPGGSFYSPFLQENVNYIDWLTNSILSASQLLNQTWGLPTHIENNVLQVPLGASVTLSFDCLGFGITSFWIAFVSAYGVRWQKALLWAIIGVVMIWIINCFRIAILLWALQHKWAALNIIDHHDAFNIVAYLIIGLLSYGFHRESRSATTTKSSEGYLKEQNHPIHLF